MGDLPATPGRGRPLAWSLAAFAVAAIAVVLLTVRSNLGAGAAYGEVLVLCLMYGTATLATLAVPWSKLDERWLIGLVALPVVFTASLSAITGAGASPYSALYAPLLAIVGWQLSLRQTLMAAMLVGATEIWRAWMVDGSGSMAQLAVALPFDVGVALVAFVAATYLRAALIVVRRDQVRLASALDAVRQLGTDPSTGVLEELRTGMARVFEADARLIYFDQDRVGDEAGSSLHAGRTVNVTVSGPTRLYGVISLAPRTPLSSQEVRLANMLAEAAGRIAEAGQGAPRER